MLKTAKRACSDTWKKKRSMMLGGQLKERRIRLNVFGPSTTNRPVHSEYNATQIDRSCMVCLKKESIESRRNRARGKHPDVQRVRIYGLFKRREAALSRSRKHFPRRLFSQQFSNKVVGSPGDHVTPAADEGERPTTWKTDVRWQGRRRYG